MCTPVGRYLSVGMAARLLPRSGLPHTESAGQSAEFAGVDGCVRVLPDGVDERELVGGRDRAACLSWRPLGRGQRCRGVGLVHRHARSKPIGHLQRRDPMGSPSRCQALGVMESELPQ